MIHSIWDGHTNALMCRLTRVISSPLCLCLVKKHHSTINDHIIFFNQKVFSVFLFLHKILVYYTSEVPLQGTSNKYPQHVFMEN